MQMRDLWVLAVLGAAACGGVLGCGGCSSPHGATTPPPPGDGAGGGGDPDGGGGNPPPPSDAGPVSGTLRVDPANPRYFTAGHGAVYLTGSHTWANFKDRAPGDPPPPFDYNAFLAFLAVHRHNFFRLWTWEQPHSADNVPLYFTPFAWPRVPRATPASDGKPPFDLGQFNQAYFDRMRTRVIAARDRGIYVSIMLFDGWDLNQGYDSAGGFPMATGNNVNGVATTPDEFLSLSNSAITKLQKAYITKVIDTVNDLDNVLYEIANETGSAPATIAWQYAMIDFVKSYEKTKPSQHPVGMTSTYPAGKDSDLYASNADWISPNAMLASGDGRKVVLNDTDHSYGWSDMKRDGTDMQRQWAWENFCRGAAPLFMDPYLEVWVGRNSPSSTPDLYWNTIRDALGYTALYASKLDLERAVPSTSVCSTTYCLVDPGHQYLVYQPDGGSFQLDVAAGGYRAEWFNPAAEQATDGGTMALAAGQRTFTPPFSGDAVLLLLAQ
jgi:hypothetical protein